MTRREAPAWALTLELAGLSAVAVAQPVLELVAREPTFLVAHRARPLDVVAFAAALIGGPALAMATLALLSRRVSARLGRIVYAALFASLAALLLAPLLDRAGLGVAGLGVAAAGGGAAGALRARWRPPAAWIAMAAVAVLAVSATFLLRGGVAPLVRPPGRADVARTIARPAPVVVIVLDELPLSSLLAAPDRIDAERYPAFGELAASSTWYRGALTGATTTDLALPALLAGARPRHGTPPDVSRYPINLFTMLAGHYEMHAVEPLTQLCPVGLCSDGGAALDARRLASLLRDGAAIYLHAVLPDALERYLPPVEGRWTDFWSEPSAKPSVVEGQLDHGRAFLEFVATIRRTDRPVLHLAHVLLPHFPHETLPTGQKYAQAREQPPPAWPPDDPRALQAEKRHLLQVAYADRVLGRAIARLRRAGVWDEALVVVASDHGISYRPGHPSRCVDESNAGDVAPVPLFVKEPGQREGRVEAAPFDTIGLLPRLAEILGVSPAPGAPEPRGAPSASQAVVCPGGASRRIPLSTPWLDEAVRRKTALFGTGGLDRVFAAGPARDLVGRRLGSIARGRSERRASVDQQELLRAVDPDGPYVPALLTGFVSPPGARWIAAAVNGTVGGVAPVDPADGGFAVLVQPSLLRAGENDVRLLEVDAAPGGVVRELGRGAGEFAIRRGELIVGDRSLPLRGGDPPGEIEASVPLQAGMVVRGWAGDPGAGQAADEVVIFAQGRFVARAPVVVFRPDLGARRGASAAFTGFAVEVPAVGDERHVRVFAVSPDGHAAELTRRPALGAEAAEGDRGTPLTRGPM